MKLKHETQFVRTVKDCEFSMINNTVLRDEHLSWKAKGIMCYVLSLPDTWIIYTSEIAKHATDGRDSLRTGIAELEKHGYIIKQQVKNDKGQFMGYNYLVVEKPSNTPFQPETDFPTTDIPISVIPLQVNTDNNNTNILSKKDNKVQSDDSTAYDEPIFNTFGESINIFRKGRTEHQGNFDIAMGLVKSFIEIDYPEYRSKQHVKIDEAVRATFAIKICDFCNVTGVDIDDMRKIFRIALLDAVEGCDPQIMYLTTPQVLGYWALKLKWVGGDTVYKYECFKDTDYAPVNDYYYV